MEHKEYLYRNIALHIVDLFRKSNALQVYEEIRHNTRLNRELLIEIQRKRLKDLLIHCYYNVPYYSRLFKEFQVDPYKDNSFEELSKLPILTKDLVRENLTYLKANNFHDFVPRFKATAGSTGQPFIFFWDKKTHSYAWANIWRCMEEAGYTLGEQYAMLTGGGLFPEQVTFKTRVYLFLNHVIHLPAYHLTDTIMERYISILKSKQPQLIYGYPTALWAFSKFLEKREERISNLYSAITTSEMLLKNQREYIERILNCTVYDQYGTNDAGILSYECQLHDGYHYNMESAYVEIIGEDSKPLSHEETGEVVSTNLVCYSMPFLRYAPNDRAALSEKICPCGNNLTKIIKIEGRERDFITNKEGRKIHGAFFNHFNPFYNSKSLHRFQIIQQNPGEIDVLLVPKDNNIDPDEKNKILIELEKGLKPIDINIKIVNDVIYTRTGKFKVIYRDIKLGEI